MLQSQASATSTLTVLGPGTRGPRATVQVCSFRDCVAILEAQFQPCPFQTVAVEHEDSLLLGEVVDCMPQPNRWRITVLVTSVLRELRNLERFRAEIGGSSE